MRCSFETNMYKQSFKHFVEGVGKLNKQQNKTKREFVTEW